MPRRWLWLALLCALVLTQSLGFVHKALHSTVHNSVAFSPVQAQAHDQAHDHLHDQAHALENSQAHVQQAGHTQPAASVANWLGALFADHSTESDCRLHDGLSASDAYLWANVTVLPSLLASFYIAFSRITATARAAALYDARGPPATL